MSMKMILFDSAALAHDLKSVGVAVMLQNFGNSQKYAVADTPEIRGLINNMKGYFDWSQAITVNHLCF